MASPAGEAERKVKHMKKFLALVLAALLSVSVLVSCKKDTAQEGDGTTAAGVASTTIPTDAHAKDNSDTMSL